jgi:hypothetical protein
LLADFLPIVSSFVRGPLLGLLVLLSACGGLGANPFRVAELDFEQPGPGIGPPPGLPGFRAHSGANVLTVATGTEFTPIYPARALGLAVPAGVPRRLRLRAWVWLPSGRTRNTVLVATVNCGGRRPDVWQGLSLNQVVRRFQKWERVELPVTLPADLVPFDQLTVYVWHQEADGEPTYVDDVEIDAWP